MPVSISQLLKNTLTIAIREISFFRLILFAMLGYFPILLFWGIKTPTHINTSGILPHIMKAQYAFYLTLALVFAFLQGAIIRIAVAHFAEKNTPCQKC